MRENHERSDAALDFVQLDRHSNRMTQDILTRVEGHAGFISLNRPSALHALTLDMVHAMTEMLQKWQRSKKVKCVIIDHAEGRGFCAGGDIAFLRDSALNDGGKGGRKFFHDEYQLNHLLFTYPKPVVAFMDGITMGGGVGISQPAKYRVSTENTRLAMPETGIGLFPDVGGGWYLSRLEGRVGQFLALTGARLDGAECDALGLATHYLPSETLDEAKARIANEDVDRIDGILGTLAVTPPEARIVGNLFDINRHFASDRLEDILASLEADESDWAMRELATLRTKSPQTCKVALRQLATSVQLKTFADNMVMEYRIGSRVLTRPDFAEGVRAVIVDKDHAPKWDPATPEGVTDALLDDIFAPLPKKEEWKPL
jgi:enoyl-CoA hydratase